MVCMRRSVVMGGRARERDRCDGRVRSSAPPARGPTETPAEKKKKIKPAGTVLGAREHHAGQRHRRASSSSSSLQPRTKRARYRSTRSPLSRSVSQSVSDRRRNRSRAVVVVVVVVVTVVVFVEQIIYI